MNKVYSQDLVKTLSDSFKNNSKLNAEKANYVKAQKDFAIAQFSPIASIGNLYLDNIR